MNPLVTVICIAYNHAPYISEALNSVLAQSYPNTQIIILDDGSTDNGPEEIQRCISEKPEVVFIPHVTNQGYTKTFNQGLALAKGKYIVDFALDDVMHADFLSRSV